MQPDSTGRAAANFTSSNRSADAHAAVRRSGFVPMLLLSLAMVGWLAFQTLQQVNEQQQLALAHANQETQQQAAAKVRAALEAVATATARLASAGNVNARVIVEELRKRGVTINTAAASPSK